MNVVISVCIYNTTTLSYGFPLSLVCKFRMCLQLLGLSLKAEKDEVVKAVMDLKGSEIEAGYTEDAIFSRQVLQKI